MPCTAPLSQRTSLSELSHAPRPRVCRGAPSLPSPSPPSESTRPSAMASTRGAHAPRREGLSPSIKPLGLSRAALSCRYVSRSQGTIAAATSPRAPRPPAPTCVSQPQAQARRQARPCRFADTMMLGEAGCWPELPLVVAVTVTVTSQPGNPTRTAQQAGLGSHLQSWPEERQFVARCHHVAMPP